MISGIGVSKGYAIGTAYVMNTEEAVRFKETAESSCTEIERLDKAIKKSEIQIEEISGKAHENLDMKNAQIIESHLNLLKDPALIEEAVTKINQELVSAEKAIFDVTESLYKTFIEFDDVYTRERAADIKDVGSRILRNLSGQEEEVDFKNLPNDSILFAHDLKPSVTIQIDKQKVAAFVTEIGGKTSHTAILAKALGIAAVVGCKGALDAVHNGVTVIVNGVSGEVIVNPDEKMLQKYHLMIEEYNHVMAEAASSTQKQIQSKDGRKILVAANIGSLQELKFALENGADGVGLFRTEFLYMGRQTMPSEEEQFQIYKEAVDLLNGKPLTIRTLDIGGDKSLPYLKMDKEENPFLGLRAIRLCLKHPKIFETQLRAILRASAYGPIQIMFPMISSLDELMQAKTILDSCKSQLKQEGYGFDANHQTGMMIEIPSSAIMAEEFAKSVDFFSIGTNDLTQYTLAADRMNENISDIYNPMHPAVLRLIKMSVEAAHMACIPCYMCGELAADETAIPLLLEYGLDEFSVSPGMIRETKKILIQNTES